MSELWRKQLIKEYGHNKKELELQQTKLTEDDPDQKVYSSMISEMKYAIKWLKQGYEPRIYSKSIYNKKLMEKGLEVKNRKEVIFTDDNNWLGQIAIHHDVIEGIDEIEEKTLTRDEMKAITTALSILTERQLNCFILHEANMLPMDQIAKEIGVTKATVQTHIEAARKRISEFVSDNEINLISV